MSTPTIRINSGAAATTTLAAALTSNSFVQCMRLHPGNGGANKVDLTLPVNMTAPVTGALQAILVPRDAAGNAGGTPSAALLWRAISFDPRPSSGNTAGQFVFSALDIDCPDDCDVWLYNNALGQSIPSGAVLNAQLWSVGIA